MNIFFEHILLASEMLAIKEMESTRKVFFCFRDGFKGVSCEHHVISVFSFSRVWSVCGGVAGILFLLIYFHALCSSNEHMFPLMVTSILHGSLDCYDC